MKQKLLSIFLTVVMIFQCLIVLTLPIHGATSGSCGDGVTWNLDSSTGTMTISGYGEMTNYASWTKVPWYSSAYSVKNLVISDGITSLGDHAFESFKIKSVTIPSSVRRIGVSTFASCNNLTSVEFESNTNLTTIEERGFYCCSNLPSISIPESVTSLGKQAFGICTKLLQRENGVAYADKWVTECDKDITTAVLRPDTVGIGYTAFSNTKNLVSVTLPSSLKHIVFNAFSTCCKLVEVINHSSLVLELGGISNGYVARYAKEIHSGDSRVVSKGDYLFYTVGGINYLVCYAGNGSVLTLPSDFNGETYELNQYLFNYYGTLKEITIPSAVTSIGYEAFLYCGSLEKLTFEANSKLTNIDGWAFRECKKLTSIDIPEGVTSIKEDTFYNCIKLTKVTVPSSVTSIGYRAFYTCKTLTDVIFAKNSKLDSIGEMAFYSCQGLVNINIPSSVTSIGDNAFAYCEALESVTIEKNSRLTSLKGYAFYQCTNLKKLNLPSSLESIGTYSLCYSSSLENIIYCGTEEEWNAVNKGYNWNRYSSATVQYHNYIDGVCHECGDGSIENSVALGDVDHDGEITNADVLMIYRYIYNEELYPLEKEIGDVDHDGDITNADVLMIYRYIFNPTLYPIN